MYCAEVYITIKGNNDTLLAALNELRTCINNRNEKEREYIRWRKPEEFTQLIAQINEAFEKHIAAASAKKSDTDKLSFLLPLGQYVMRTEDIDDWDMLGTTASLLKDDSMTALISLEGPGNSSKIIWLLENGMLWVKYYDWDADWEDYDEDEESDSKDDEGTTISYVYTEGKWERVEEPSHIPFVSEENSKWMKSIESWESLTADWEKARTIVADLVQNHMTDAFWKENIRRYRAVFGKEKMKEMQNQEETKVQLIFDEINFDFEQDFISNVYEFFDNCFDM